MQSRVSAVALGIVLVVGPGAGEARGQADVAALESFVDALAADYGLSMAVGVSRNGMPVLSKAYGLADRDAGLANTGSTRFRIGSVTKQFTAAAVLILRDEGRIELGRPVSAYLPELPERWQGITVHQLLTHTSGIMHSWSQPQFLERMGEPRSIRQVVESFYDEPLLFAPGAGFAYSGVGYFVLALLVERVAGQPYDEFLRARIFEPLGMRATGAERPGVGVPSLARGYRWSEGAVREVEAVHMPVFTGGGNLYSSVENLLIWDRALAEGDLLSEESLRLMHTPERDDHAYGWFVRSEAGRLEYSHGGGVPGFNAYVARYPESGIAVVVLSNVEGTGVGALAKAISARVHRGSESQADTWQADTWIGIFSPPGGGYWDMVLDVSGEGTAVKIRGRDWAEEFEFTDAALTGGQLRFSLGFYGDRADCVLHLEASGSYFGPCTVNGEALAAMRIRPGSQ